MDGKTIRILFLGGAKRVSMGEKFIDAGRRLGMTVELFSYELSSCVPIASVAGIIIGKKWSDPDILGDIHKQVAQLHIDIIVPFVDGAVDVAALYRDNYGDAWVPVGDTGQAAVMFDKVKADKLFRQLGLPVPGKDRFPMIAKPRFGSASKGIVVLNNPDELRDHGISDDNYLVQNYIANRREITADCYVSLSGELVAAVPRYRIEVQGGEASVTETFHNPDVEDLVRRTLLSTGLRGAVTVQIILDTDTSRLMLMEINPRLGGGAVCACHAGANLPEFMLRDFLGLPPLLCDNWRPGIRICRYFSEVSFDMSTQQACKTIQPTDNAQ